MQPENQPDNIDQDQNRAKIRETYERLLQQPVPQRARGIPYDYIIWYFQIPAILLSIILLDWVNNKLHCTLVNGLTLIFLLWFFFIYAERFYSMSKRTARNAFRRYPQLRRTARRLNEKGSRFLPDGTILKIDGRNLFILRYGFVRWWVVTQHLESSGEINGMVLVDDQGRVIDTPELFEKAHMTMILSDLGDHALQFRDRKRRADILHTQKNILPRVERLLKRQAKTFAANHVGLAYEQMMAGIPFLEQALITGMSIYSVHTKWRKALGWSFGLECLYEDALQYRATCLAYSHFMAAEYGKQIVDLSNRANELIQTVSSAEHWRGRKKAIWALSMLLVIPKAVQSWIYTYGVLGKPSPEDMDSFRRKINKARSEGTQILSQ